jgi:DNA-binding MarR family transcriptional regulator
MSHYIDKVKQMSYTHVIKKEKSEMSSDREALLGEAQRLHMLVRWVVFQEVIVPSSLELHISMAQLKGVLVLASLGQSTIREFAEMLHISPSAGSLLVDRLVQDGLVERTEDQEDRRRMVIRLSKAGMELVTRLYQKKAEHDPFPTWFARLSANNLQALVQGLSALVTEAQTDLERPLPQHILKEFEAEDGSPVDK